MKLTIASISAKSGKSRANSLETAVDDYLSRSARYMPTVGQTFATEAAFFENIGRLTGRVPARLILCDSKGDLLTSTQFAAHVERHRDAGVQHLVLAIGPADGWSEQAHLKADLLVSFGRMTLPHELARLILAEQVYRALTILAGHPYHSGH